MSRIFVAYKGTFLAFPTSNGEWNTLTKLFEGLDMTQSYEDMVEQIDKIEELVRQYKDVTVQISQEKIMKDITDKMNLTPENILIVWVLYLYKLIKNEIINMDDNNGYFMRNIDETGEETWQQLII
jgi:hypothetical protein